MTMKIFKKWRDYESIMLAGARVIFQFLMAVGTIVCASLWSEFIASEQGHESYDQLIPKVRGAVVFVIVASVFLMLLYFMSGWFIWLLIELFCIGGTELLRHFWNLNFSPQSLQKERNARLPSYSDLRIFKSSGNKKVNLPRLGEITVLSMGVLPFCLALPSFGLPNQHVSYAWVAKMFLSHPYLYWVIPNGWAWSTCTPISCSLYFGYILKLASNEDSVKPV
ncbi:hypothetical protein MKW98_028387 [Papaver atlanticum]|uniref:Uncharacterized protein n=1 Tax=Papaver atlanticum TaxID=357466 RepID=A0AAD4SWI2_9MAGN|nr:hypothetical protein MKW98_028387 [Papaver atlanticum]